jgi:hypothetical protein
VVHTPSFNGVIFGGCGGRNNALRLVSHHRKPPDNVRQ